MWIFFKVFYFVIRDSQEDFGGSKFLYKNYARQCRKSFYVAVRVSIQFRVLHSLSVAYLVNPISIVCQDNQGRPRQCGITASKLSTEIFAALQPSLIYTGALASHIVI
eukprot:TRINITY_DN6402_c0_g1_i2.p9 TRINITY_DN6402_c0_g1~~TRINITY_DN6402_c0_g1_i2.p9  ORF type:complete len:108 (-),score=0.38 TRINITY_DN6402_c0_g1_i2:1446-1769(-)